MKRRIKKTIIYGMSMLLILLTGCKSKEATTVESLINGLSSENFTIASGEDITAAKEAYAALNEKDAQSVSNSEALEEIDKAFAEYYKEQANIAADKVVEANEKINEYDLDSAYSLLTDTLPLAEELKNSSYSELLTEDPVKVIQDWLDLIDQICYPSTHLIELENYIKVAKVSNADISDSNYGEGYNVSKKTGLKYLTYMFSNGEKLVNAFTAYTDYFGKYLELGDIERDDNSFTYHYSDPQGRKFVLEALIYDLGSYGSYYWICVHVDDSIELPKS